jgi:hypothetical protein
MVIGEDITVFGDDHTRAKALLAGRAQLATGPLGAFVSKESAEEWVVEFEGQAGEASSGLLEVVTCTTLGMTFLTTGAKPLPNLASRFTGRSSTTS